MIPPTMAPWKRSMREWIIKEQMAAERRRRAKPRPAIPYVWPLLLATAALAIVLICSINF